MIRLNISANQNGAQWAEGRLKTDQHAKRDDMDTAEKEIRVYADACGSHSMIPN